VEKPSPLSDKTILRALGVLGTVGCMAGAITACNAVATDAGPARLTAGVVLLLVGLACFVVSRYVRA
jgi:hypothetical protein